MISTVIRWKFELNNEIKGYIYVKDRGKDINPLEFTT